MASKNIQLCATVSEDLNSQVLEIAGKDKRTFSQTVALLLEKAIYERNRKRKKNPSQHNSADPR